MGVAEIIQWHSDILVRLKFGEINWFCLLRNFYLLLSFDSLAQSSAWLASSVYVHPGSKSGLNLG